MKIYTLALAGLLALIACQKNQPIRLAGNTMGTTYHITIADENNIPLPISDIQFAVDSILLEVNRKMSTFIKDSEISRFNRWQKTDPFIVSKEFVSVLGTALQIYRESNGAFDVTVAPLVNLWGFGNAGSRQITPPLEHINQARKHIGSDKLLILNDSTIVKEDSLLKLDLSAIAKGYGVDVVSRMLDNLGLHDYLVEIGGEVVAKGLKYGQKWRIGIDHPDYNAVPGKNLEAVLLLSNAAVATSGDYRNYFMVGDTVYTHAIDPANGKPVINGVASVTVIAPQCTLADAMATAIMVMGAEKGLQMVENKPDMECLIILRTKSEYRTLKSTGFGKYLD